MLLDSLGKRSTQHSEIALSTTTISHARSRVQSFFVSTSLCARAHRSQRSHRSHLQRWARTDVESSGTASECGGRQRTSFNCVTALLPAFFAASTLFFRKSIEESHVARSSLPFVALPAAGKKTIGRIIGPNVGSTGRGGSGGGPCVGWCDRHACLVAWKDSGFGAPLSRSSSVDVLFCAGVFPGAVRPARAPAQDEPGAVPQRLEAVEADRRGRAC